MRWSAVLVSAVVATACSHAEMKYPGADLPRVAHSEFEISGCVFVGEMRVQKDGTEGYPPFKNRQIVVMTQVYQSLTPDEILQTYGVPVSAREEEAARNLASWKGDVNAILADPIFFLVRRWRLFRC